MQKAACKLRTPLGRYYPDPTRDQISDLLFNTEQSFWTEDLGRARVDYSSASLSSAMIFTVKEGFGCHVAHSIEGHPLYASWNGQATGKYTSVFSGGEFFNMDASLFVNLDVALEVIWEFCGTGQRGSRVEWKLWDEVNAVDELYGDPY